MKSIVFTTGEIAKLMGVTPQTAVNWCNNGTIPSYRNCRGPRCITKSDLIKFIEEKTDRDVKDIFKEEAEK